MPVIIRQYDEQTDARPVGILIAETYRRFNLGFASKAEQKKFLGPFFYAKSDNPSRQLEIRRVLRAEFVFVAENHEQIVGVIRGKPSRIQSLFVQAEHHRQGIGRMLVERCEQECRSKGSKTIHLAATLYAIPFYSALGYKKSTGLRIGWSFTGYGLMSQPMKKIFPSCP